MEQVPLSRDADEARHLRPRYDGQPPYVDVADAPTMMPLDATADDDPVPPGMAATPGGDADGQADHGAPQLLPDLPEPVPDPDFEVLTPPGLDEDDVVPSPSLISDLSGQLEIEVSPETTMSEETSDPQADLPPGLPQQPALPVQPQQRYQAPAGTLNEALRNPGRLCSNSTGQEDHREGQAACEAQSEDWSRKGGDLQDLHQ